MRQKIISGQYVSFENLLPEDAMFDGGTTAIPLGEPDEEGKRLLLKDEATYHREIDSHKIWGSAFRIYCSVLTGAFPEKAPELLEYHSCIDEYAFRTE